MPSVEIARQKGSASHYVDATITDDGDLRMIRNSFGPGDYETEVTAAVPAAEKDQLLLALLERLYAGNTQAVEAFTEFAKAKSLTVNHFRWP